MIARIWRDAFPEAKGDAYMDYLRETGIREYTATPGSRGVLVLPRFREKRAEFLPPLYIFVVNLNRRFGLPATGWRGRLHTMVCPFDGCVGPDSHVSTKTGRLQDERRTLTSELGRLRKAERRYPDGRRCLRRRNSPFRRETRPPTEPSR
jgi:hypothetical protein